MTKDDNPNLALLDRALAEGLDSGRYTMKVIRPGEQAHPYPGPRYDDDGSKTSNPELRWAQMWLDEAALRQREAGQR